MVNRLNVDSLRRRTASQVQAVTRPTEDRGRFKHILLPTQFSLPDLSAVLTAFEYAAFHRARLTVLRSLPFGEGEPKSLHWLHALDRLHEVLNTNFRQWRSLSMKEFIDCVENELADFLDAHVSPHLRQRVEVCLEHRFGDLAEQAAKYADENEVDLVVVTGKRPSWWHPFLPSETRRMVQLVRPPCVVVMPCSHPHTRANSNNDAASSRV